MARMQRWGRPCVSVRTDGRYERYFFPEDAQIDDSDWLVVDISKSHLDTSRTVSGTRELDAGSWRKARLDDLADGSISVSIPPYGFAASLPTADLVQFLSAHQNTVLESVRRISAAVAEEQHHRVLELYDDDYEMVARLSEAPAAVANRFQIELAHARVAIDDKELDRLLTEPDLDIPKLLQHTKQIASGAAFARAMRELGARLREAQLPDDEMQSILGDCVFDHTQFARRIHDPQNERRRAEIEFWISVAEYFSFSQNVRNERIDITNARLHLFQANHRAARGRRVGNLKPGRRCLLISDRTGIDTYIAGGKRLKVEVAKNRGELKFKGVTLTLGAHEDSELNELLLEVEQLELLATTNPKAALERLGRDISPTEPMAIAAQRAETNYRWGHMLADLMIEELFEIDADVIRRMIRSQQTF